MVSEFHSRKIECTPEQACIFTTGDAVLDAYSVHTDMKYPYAAVCFTFTVGFTVIAYFAMAKMHKQKQ